MSFDGDWELPLQNLKLNCIDLPTFHDVKNLIDNIDSPDNTTMLIYWLRKLEEKCKLLGVTLAYPDDVVILGAIELGLFVKDLEKGDYV